MFGESRIVGFPLLPESVFLGVIPFVEVTHFTFRSAVISDFCAFVSVHEIEPFRTMPSSDLIF